MALGKQKGAESGGVDKMAQDNFPSHSLPGGTGSLWHRFSTHLEEGEQTKGEVPFPVVTVGVKGEARSKEECLKI